MALSLRVAAFAAVLSIGAPVWAQAPTTAGDLNRRELDRLAHALAAPAAVAPAISYSVSPPVPLVPQVLPQAVLPPPGYNIGYQSSAAAQYPFAWVNRYYGYPLSVTYDYADLGTSGYYVPVAFIAGSWTGQTP
jgi:hypothetical protein